MSGRDLLVLLASMCLASTALAQSSVPVRPTQNRTITATPPPPPPDKRANPPGSTPGVPPCGTAGGPPCDTNPSETPRDPGPEAAPATSAPRTPGGAQIAQRPSTIANSRLRRELLLAATEVAEADQQRAWLSARGAQLLRRRTLTQLGWVLSVYRLAPDKAVAPLMAELVAQWPSALPEINQRFAAFGSSGAQAPAEYARALIAWPERCAGQVRIAMLDGPVNVALPSLADRSIHNTQIAPGGPDPNYHHGTALAALLVSPGAPLGLLPDADLVVGVIMESDDDGPFTTTEWVLRGLDWVLGLEPRPMALNLSFGGPRSAQMQRALEVVTRVLPVAAAVGNEGHTQVAYPASYPGVVAVTAVDAKRRRWPRANIGNPVAIAAPGVEVWTLDGAGRGYYANGTSIATLFVTAALTSAPPDQRSLDEWIAAHAVEAGPAGRDLEYGHGVLAMRGACRRNGS